jgi:hypothetical protein
LDPDFLFLMTGVAAMLNVVGTALGSRPVVYLGLAIVGWGTVLVIGAGVLAGVRIVTG